VGKFVVVEGLDGAGTTTQSARLVAHLEARGVAVLATREPTGRPVGQLIRRVLREEPDTPSPAALPWLFAADRADHLASVVEPALNQRKWVVSDRYYPSSLAYQSVEQPLERVLALNAGFRVPDLTFFLHVPVNTCLQRIGGRAHREIFENQERLELVEARYQAVMALLRARGEPVIDVDGSAPVDEVAARLAAEVDRL
jgi:dTMP kinase